jgi:hypothetical protein
MQMPYFVSSWCVSHQHTLGSGPYGHAESVRQRGHTMIRLSSLILNHQVIIIFARNVNECAGYECTAAYLTRIVA